MALGLSTVTVELNRSGCATSALKVNVSRTVSPGALDELAVLWPTLLLALFTLVGVFAFGCSTARRFCAAGVCDSLCKSRSASFRIEALASRPRFREDRRKDACAVFKSIVNDHSVRIKSNVRSVTDGQIHSYHGGRSSAESQLVSDVFAVGRERTTEDATTRPNKHANAIGSIHTAIPTALRSELGRQANFVSMSSSACSEELQHVREIVRQDCLQAVRLTKHVEERPSPEMRMHYLIGQ